MALLTSTNDICTSLEKDSFYLSYCEYAIKKHENMIEDPHMLSRLMSIDAMKTKIRSIQNRYLGDGLYKIDDFKKNYISVIEFIIQRYGLEQLEGVCDKNVGKNGIVAIEQLNGFTTELIGIIKWVLDRCLKDLENIPLPDTSIDREICDTLRAYTQRYHKNYHISLQMQVQEYKDQKKGKSETEIWEQVSSDERCMYDLAVNQQLAQTDDTRFKHLDNEFRKDLQNNKDLVAELRKISLDGTLWCQNNHGEHYVDMKDVTNVLTVENMLFYCKLALRHNLIQSMMNPELNKEFFEWMNGEKEEEEELLNKLTESNKVLNLKVLLHEKYVERNILQMYNFIKENFVQKIHTKSEWYALFIFLDKLGYLNKSTTSDFADQMNNWYPDAKASSDRSEINRYSFLAGYDVEYWDSIPNDRYPANVTKKGVNAIKQDYITLMKKHDEMK